MNDTYMYLPQSYSCGAQTQPGFPNANQFVADQDSIISVDLATSTPEKTDGFGSTSRNLDYTSTVQCGNQPAWSGGNSISSMIDPTDGMRDAFPPIAHQNPQHLPFSISRDEGSDFFHPNFVSPFSTHYPTCLDYSPFSNAWAPPISISMMIDEQTAQSDMMMTGGTDDCIVNGGEISPSVWDGFPQPVDPNQVLTRLQTTPNLNHSKFMYSIPADSPEKGNPRKRKRPDGTFSTNTSYKNKELLLVASGEAAIREDRTPQRHAGMRMRRSHRFSTSDSNHGDASTTGIVPPSEMTSLEISPESGFFSYPSQDNRPSTIAFSDVLLQDVPGFQGPLVQNLHVKHMQQEIQEDYSAIQQDTDSETMSVVSISSEPQPSSALAASPSRHPRTGPFRIQRSKSKRKAGDSRNTTPEIPDHGIFGISQPCTTTDPGSHLIHLGCPFAVALPPDERVGRDCWQVHRKDLAGIKEHIGRSHIPDLHRNPVEHGDVIRNRARDWSTFFQKCYPGWGDSKNIPRPWVLWNLKTRTICTEREHYAHTPLGSLEELSAKYRVPLESPANKKSRSTPSQDSSPRTRASRGHDSNPLQRIMAVLEMLTPHEELSDATARNWSAFINGVQPDELDAVVRLSDAFRANLHLLHQPTVTSSIRGSHTSDSPKASWQSINSSPHSQASTVATPSTEAELTPTSSGFNEAGDYAVFLESAITQHISGPAYSSKLPALSL